MARLSRVVWTELREGCLRTGRTDVVAVATERDPPVSAAVATGRDPPMWFWLFSMNAICAALAKCLLREAEDAAIIADEVGVLYCRVDVALRAGECVGKVPPKRQLRGKRRREGASRAVG